MIQQRMCVPTFSDDAVILLIWKAFWPIDLSERCEIFYTQDDTFKYLNIRH